MSGLKYDDGKAPIQRGFIDYFPRAIKAVALISGYGFEKYKAWGGWKTVPDGEARYEDACGRHTLDRVKDGPYDPESKHLHRAHRAWNALATLELELMRLENVTEAVPDQVPYDAKRAEKDFEYWRDNAKSGPRHKVVPPLQFSGPHSQLEAGKRYDAGGESQTKG